MKTCKKIITVVLILSLFVTQSIPLNAYTTGDNFSNDNLPGPKNLVLTNKTSSMVSLGWEAPEGYGEEMEYEIYNGATVVEVVYQTTAEIVNLTPNTKYTFFVKARDIYYNLSEASNTIEVITLLETPVNITSEATEKQIRLTWNPIAGATSYEIKVDNEIKRIQQTSYTHLDLLPGTEHSYRLRALSEDNMSDWSEVIVKNTIDGIPGNFKAAPTTTSIRVTWNSVVDALKYDIEVDGIVISNVEDTSYYHKGLKSGTQHQYRVRAQFSAELGQWSSWLTADTKRLGIPQNLKNKSGADFVELSWDPVDEAVQYEIEADGKIIGNTYNTSFIHQGIERQKTVRYKVRAVNEGGVSEWNQISTAVTTVLKAPENICTTQTDTQIYIAWDPVQNATKYEVEVNGQIVNNGNNLVYIHSGLVNGLEYSYRVRAGNAAGNGIWSEVLVRKVAKLSDSRIGDWVTKAPLSAVKSRLGVVVVNGKLYAIGGRTSVAVATVEEYDPMTDKWVLKTSMPTPRSDFAIAAINGKIYVMGGAGNTYLNTVEEYDPESDTWTSKTGMPNARGYMKAAVVGGKIYVVGGQNSKGHVNTIEEYDPINDIWVQKASMPTARSELGLEEVGGKIYAIGGKGESNIYLNIVEEYDPQADQWKKKAVLPQARSRMATAVVNERIYIIGGYNGSSYLNKVEEYDPNTNVCLTQNNMISVKGDTEAGVRYTRFAGHR